MRTNVKRFPVIITSVRPAKRIGILIHIYSPEISGIRSYNGSCQTRVPILVYFPDTSFISFRQILRHISPFFLESLYLFVRQTIPQEKNFTLTGCHCIVSRNIIIPVERWTIGIFVWIDKIRIRQISIPTWAERYTSSQTELSSRTIILHAYILYREDHLVRLLIFFFEKHFIGSVKQLMPQFTHFSEISFRFRILFHPHICFTPQCIRGSFSSTSVTGTSLLIPVRQ